MINYGVIVGRFQVDSLHPGHLELFRHVSEKHQRVIVFIGVARTIPTIRNPLDFETRKKMIQAEYPDFIILPLRDEKSDQFWSYNLDNAIASVTNFTGRISLYGGRDSFTPHYYGTHPVQQVTINSPISGTEIRAALSNRVMQSPQFRAGVIYAASNRFPAAIPTVDVAIFHDTGTTIKMLLGKKIGETRFRFIGGFVEPSTTLESNARREVLEETNLDITSVEYIGSFCVDDWRYRQDKDAKIITSLFSGWSLTPAAKPKDDIQEVKWFDVFPLNQIPDMVEDAHAPLLDAVKKYVGKRYAHVPQSVVTN